MLLETCLWANLIGKAPMNRNEFDPGMVLADNDDILVFDSNNLPDGWKEKISNLNCQS